MGIAGIFGFGKKAPFKVPAEVATLRTRIAAEERENYPSLARFEELQQDADAIYTSLDAVIAGKEYTEEAARIREDLEKRMAVLGAKIESNQRAAKSDDSGDYVPSNVDYLERKSTRNGAKTVFTEFLEAHELLMRTGTEGRAGRGEQIHAATARIMRALSELHDKFFSAHGNDREIREMRDLAIKKIAELNSLLARAMASTQDYGVRASLAADVQRLSAMAAKISSI